MTQHSPWQAHQTLDQISPSQFRRSDRVVKKNTLNHPKYNGQTSDDGSSAIIFPQPVLRTTRRPYTAINIRDTINNTNQQRISTAVRRLKKKQRTFFQNSFVVSKNGEPPFITAPSKLKDIHDLSFIRISESTLNNNPIVTNALKDAEFDQRLKKKNQKSISKYRKKFRKDFQLNISSLRRLNSQRNKPLKQQSVIYCLRSQEINSNVERMTSKASLKLKDPVQSCQRQSLNLYKQNQLLLKTQNSVISKIKKKDKYKKDKTCSSVLVNELWKHSIDNMKLVVNQSKCAFLFPEGKIIKSIERGRKSTKLQKIEQKQQMSIIFSLIITECKTLLCFTLHEIAFIEESFYDLVTQQVINIENIILLLSKQMSQDCLFHICLVKESRLMDQSYFLANLHEKKYHTKSQNTKQLSKGMIQNFEENLSVYYLKRFLAFDPQMNSVHTINEHVKNILENITSSNEQQNCLFELKQYSQSLENRLIILGCRYADSIRCQRMWLKDLLREGISALEVKRQATISTLGSKFIPLNSLFPKNHLNNISLSGDRCQNHSSSQQFISKKSSKQHKPIR